MFSARLGARMNLVVDTSIVIAVITNEPTKAALVKQTQGAELFALRSLDFEIGNAFSAMMRRGRTTLERAKAAIEIYRQIPLNLVEIDLIAGVETAAQLNIYAYDAYVIACAKSLNYPLLSLDAGLLRAAQTLGIEVLEVKQNNANNS